MMWWQRCCCCCGGCGWTEPWTSNAEAFAHWVTDNPERWVVGAGLVTSNDELSSAFGTRLFVDDVHRIQTTLDHSSNEPPDLTVSVVVRDTDPAGRSLAAGCTWGLLGGFRWFVRFDGVTTVVTPTNPLDPQVVSIWWDDAGNAQIDVGDTTTIDTVGVGAMGEVFITTTSNGSIGVMEATCDPYVPAAPEAILTETPGAGIDILTESGDPLLVE